VGVTCDQSNQVSGVNLDCSPRSGVASTELRLLLEELQQLPGLQVHAWLSFSMFAMYSRLQHPPELTVVHYGMSSCCSIS
jgi:hypothetical protein